MCVVSDADRLIVVKKVLIWYDLAVEQDLFLEDRKGYDKIALCMPRQHLPQSHGRVRYEEYGE